ncbi:MAG: hypothetical protein R2712_26655 [Vicinamibacterales bacterium]
MHVDPDQPRPVLVQLQFVPGAEPLELVVEQQRLVQQCVVVEQRVVVEQCFLFEQRVLEFVVQQRLVEQFGVQLVLEQLVVDVVVFQLLVLEQRVVVEQFAVELVVEFVGRGLTPPPARGRAPWVRGARVSGDEPSRDGDRRIARRGRAGLHCRRCALSC